MGTVSASQIVIATVMSSFALAAATTRIYARRLRNAEISWDDYTILAAVLFTIAQAVGMWIGAAEGGLGQHAEIDPDTGLPVLNRTLRVFWQINFASLLTSTLAIGLTKVSVLLFYRRIFCGTANTYWFALATWSLIIFAIGWTSAFFLGSLFQCLPIYENWVDYGSPPDHCINENAMYLAQAWTDAISDFLILLVPVPCIWSLRMPTKQKLAVTGMFFLGAVTLSVSVTKLAYFYQITTLLQGSGSDLTYYLTPTVYWPMIESSLGIVGACLPLAKPIFDDHFPTWRWAKPESLTDSKPLPNVKRFDTIVSTRGEFDSEKGAQVVMRGIDVSFGDYEGHESSEKWSGHA